MPYNTGSERDRTVSCRGRPRDDNALLGVRKGERWMKKGIGLILALALCLTVLSGCGSVLSGMLGGDENNGNGDSQTGYAQDGYAEGRMGDTMHTVFFDYTVNSAYLCDSFEGYAPSQEGFRLLVAEVTVLNTFQESIPMYDTDFQVQWGDDEDAYDVPITYYLEETLSDDQLPYEYELAVDESRTGLLVFEVPEGEKDFSISYLEFFDDNTEGDVFFVFFTAEEQGDSSAV